MSEIEALVTKFQKAQQLEASKQHEKAIQLYKEVIAQECMFCCC
jgi:hypothetical protein